MKNFVSDNLKAVLEKLDFSITKDSIVNNFPEIVFTKNPPSNLHPKHYIALEFAEILEADAVYFKYYDDNRFCVPQVYFYDSEITTSSNESIEDIHKRVYSSCQVPMICFINKTSIIIRDCREPIKEIKNKKLVENKKSVFKDVPIKEISLLKSYFSSKKLKYGLFWESDETKNHFTNNQSAYGKLVKVLSKIRKDFIEVSDKSNIPNSLATDLLFKCILIKYLEENGKDENKKENFAKDFYQKKGLEFESLKEILYHNKLIELLEHLESHFNGNVFKINSKEDKKFIKEKIDLKFLAECLDGNLDLNSQLTIWQVYSFKDIPIELISNFYEEFISNELDVNSGSVYTPSFLVNLLIDECLPIYLNPNDNEYNLKIADVSCGSGIFISSAFKRLVQRYRIKEGKDGKLIPKDSLELDKIKKILSENIFGIDRDKSAVKLTNFSLQLALCQIVPNNQLWNWTKGEVFDSLDNNIFEKDFFEFITQKEYKKYHNYFDLIVGNPPFIKYAKEKSVEFKSIEENLLKNQINISVGKNSKNQIALTFLDAMMSLSKKETGRVCQIIPSGELLYFNDSFNFRNEFFSKYNIPQIFDFTLLRRTLFADSNDTTVPVVAIFVENKFSFDENILHITFRRTEENKKKLYFELDYYDFHEVSKEIALNNTFCWKANLYGGYRILNLIDKYTDKKTVKTYLNENNIETTKSKKYNLKIKKSVFSGDFPIIKKEKGEGILLSSDNNLELKHFSENYLQDENVKYKNNFFIAVKSGRQGIRGAYTIIDSDFLNLPFFDNDNFNVSERIIMQDVVNYRIPEFGLGENAPINKHEASINELQDFANIFNQSFNSIYEKENKKQELINIYNGNDFYALEFEYGESIIYQGETTNELNINELIKNEYGNNTLINRVLRIYTPNKITLIKPKKLRYWLKSIALRDADDVFDDVIEAGY